MSRDVRLFLDDMIGSCRRVVVDSRGRSRDEVLADPKTRDAILWNLLVLGEAAKRVPDTVRHRHPSIEWRKIAGFRDVLAHGYFGLDEDVLWDVIANKVPALLEELEKLGLDR